MQSHKKAAAREKSNQGFRDLAFEVMPKILGMYNSHLMK